MRKLSVAGLAVVLVFALASGVAMAGKYNNGLFGKHYGFNIIGHPKNVDAISGDNSNGRAIMVPLKNATGPNAIVCEADEYVLADDTKANFLGNVKAQEPSGAKIHFVAGESFEIIDRDATDNDGATIMVPTEEVRNADIEAYEPVLSYDIYVRVLGKPMTCMDIDGFAYDMDQGLWFWSGSVDLNRKHGKASWVDVRHLFDVWFCQVDTTTNPYTCIDGAVELSVFNNVFEDYFWRILNDGTRIVQVRLYPKNRFE